MGISNFSGSSGSDGSNNGGIGGIGGISFSGPGAPKGMPGNDTVDAKEFLIDYNAKFAMSDPTLFRDEVIQQTLSVLISKNKPNVILVGPAGVGKTKIAEDIARRLASKDPLIPDKLIGSTIYELPLSAVISGSSYVGQVEQKLHAVIDFAQDKANQAILFIDEIHQLTDSRNPTYEKIAQILKPALARGDIRVIGATTTQEAKTLMDDPAFSRRFSKIPIDELTKAQTTEILQNAISGFLKHHNYKVSINPDLLDMVTDIAEQYKPAGSHRPDNALTLLDRSIGSAIVNRKKQEILLANDTTALQALKSISQIPVTEKIIRQTAIKLATGNAKPDQLDINAIKDALSEIKGQDGILDKLIVQLRKNELNLIPTNQPLTMLFIGPSGVGKTEVTKIIAKQLTGCDPIILNMTEYNSYASINRIIGAPAGYVGSDSNAELPFDALSSNPYQIILLDEFEKCDPSVAKLFMSVFDEGMLKTNRGDTIDFSKSIIIATTNAGHSVAKRSLGFGTSDNTSELKTDIKELSQFFDIALLNRFQERITFQPISKEIYRDIIKDKYARTVAEIKKSKPRITIADEIPDDKLDEIVRTTYAEEFGARPAHQAVSDYVYEQVL